MATSSATGAGAAVIVIFLVLIAVYMLPSIIALAKRNRRTKVILFNIFLGWTVVMWIICLVWACKRVQIAQPEAPQPQYVQYVQNQYVQQVPPTEDNPNNIQ